MFVLSCDVQEGKWKKPLVNGKTWRLWQWVSISVIVSFSIIGEWHKISQIKIKSVESNTDLIMKSMQVLFDKGSAASPHGRFTQRVSVLVQNGKLAVCLGEGCRSPSLFTAASWTWKNHTEKPQLRALWPKHICFYSRISGNIKPLHHPYWVTVWAAWREVCLRSVAVLYMLHILIQTDFVKSFMHRCLTSTMCSLVKSL